MGISAMIRCANRSCDEHFVPRTPLHIFCSLNCLASDPTHSSKTRNVTAAKHDHRKAQLERLHETTRARSKA